MSMNLEFVEHFPERIHDFERLMPDSQADNRGFAWFRLLYVLSTDSTTFILITENSSDVPYMVRYYLGMNKLQRKYSVDCKTVEETIQKVSDIARKESFRLLLS